MNKDHSSGKVILRPACESDCRSIYEWRNHPAARPFTRNKGEINYEDHIRWFSSVLSNPDRRIYYALVNGTGVGNIRFDKQAGRMAEISIMVDPEKHGRGYGTEIIKQGSMRYFDESPEVDILRACIMRGNIASLRAFEKAGYKKFKDDEVWPEYRMLR